jgi:hypothetical protein
MSFAPVDVFTAGVIEPPGLRSGPASRRQHRMLTAVCDITSHPAGACHRKRRADSIRFRMILFVDLRHEAAGNEF